MNNVEQFKKIATELGELYKKKNAAYNNSFGDTYKKLGIISAVTRISDKYNRLCNLATKILANIDNDDNIDLIMVIEQLWDDLELARKHILYLDLN